MRTKKVSHKRIVILAQAEEQADGSWAVTVLDRAGVLAKTSASLKSGVPRAANAAAATALGCNEGKLKLERVTYS